MENYDVAIIGSGPGGLEAAFSSDLAGLKTALIEEKDWGGTCLNWGCIPTKALLASGKLYSKMLHSANFGIQLNLPPVANAEMIFQQKNTIVQNLKKGIETRLRQSKITCLNGRASLIDKNKIEIKSKEAPQIISTKNIILAAGSSPKPLPGYPFDGKDILSSDDLLSLNEIPESLIIIGGGVIGVEFATFFSSLGTKIILVEALDRLLPTQDPDIGKRLELIFKKRGIQAETGSLVTKIQTETDLMRVELEGSKILKAQKVAVATGRMRNNRGLGLEAIGIKFKGPAIETNEYLETNIPHIFVIGDLLDGPQLAHAASCEAELVIHNLLSPAKRQSFDPLFVPQAVFSDPPVATIGLTMEEAQKRNLNPKELKIPLSSNGKACVERETDGLMKLVVGLPSYEILGAHLIGAEVTELIGMFSLILRKRLTAYDLAETVFPHPSFSETLGELAKKILKLK